MVTPFDTSGDKRKNGSGGDNNNNKRVNDSDGRGGNSNRSSNDGGGKSINDGATRGLSWSSPVQLPATAVSRNRNRN